MKLCYNHVVLILLLFSFIPTQAQDYWVKKKESSITQVKRSTEKLPSKYEVFEVQMDAFKSLVSNSPMRGDANANEGVEVFFPLANGELKAFRVFEAPVFDEKLSARFPDIKSYAGQGIDNPSEMIRFSVSPLGIKSMLFSSDNGYEFIEPFTEDLTHYIVYQRKDRHREQSDFECTLTDIGTKKVAEDGTIRNNADDGILRNYRIAVSTNGEYTGYFGGTVADALAAINTTMTRVNGIFETDFNVTMTLINNTTAVIYTNSGTDPYGNNSGSWNSQLQSTLTSNIGESNYDIGHLFALGGNNGNAGCIGCVCVNNQKGSGFTSRTIPEGDPFDVDYVAHEIGHQFGGNHTWTFNGNEGTNVQMEPGSGSTIMGYAGITGNTDVQSNSDPYFHATSIQQVTNYVKSTSCQTDISTGNSTPTADAGANYTIPRGTPFILTGNGSDGDGDALTYCWEQMDENNASSTYPSATATTGVAFRSISPSTSTQRIFPALSTVLSGSTGTTWEVIPNVGRTLNFRLTVRDNVAGGGSNESDNMVVTVNAGTGPFVVNSPNTNVNWTAGSSQTVTWDVAGTNGAPVNATNVNIVLSTDGGNTFSTTLASNTANDGSHIVTVPNSTGTSNRIKVEAANNIFFDVSNSDFTISGAVPCTATTPTGLNAFSISSSSADLSWNAVTGAASYDVRYRATGTTPWTTNLISGVATTVSGLSALTEYEAQVRSTCPDNSNSAYSASVTFTTTEVSLNYCASNGNDVSDEYIGNVSMAEINNTTGASASGYVDYTSQIANLTIGQSTTITITPIWTGTIYNEAYSVWIDYNKDGDFTDSGEQVYTQSNTTATPVSGSFTVPASALEVNTRMRVSMKYNGIPTSCESFTYGEVEDYTVSISAAGCTVGGSCDDGDNCTTGDVYDVSCNCAGTFQDSDNDGVCDADDQCAGSASGAIVDANGCVQGCTDVSAHNYDANAQVDDGSCETCSDNIQNGDETDIDCGGALCDPCPACNTGDPCDDGDACTTGDVYDVDCNCAGTFQDSDSDGVCDADDQCAGSAAGASVDANGCVQGCTDASAHNYNADAQVDDGSCETCSDNIQNGDETDIDCGGALCDSCPACNTGDPCDDGDACTTGDVYDVDCNCAGTFQDSDSDGVCDADDQCAGSASGASVDANGCVQGCTDISAHNYNADAQVDDGSCETCSDNIQNGDETGIDCGGALCDPCSTGCTFQEIDNHNFDSGWGIWNDGGSDCRRHSNDAPYANSGTRCVRLRDNTSTSNMTTDNIDLSSYDEAEIDFTFIAVSMDNSNEDLWLQISTNGGASYTTIQEWDTNIDFVNNVREFEVVSVSGPFTSNTRFRFRLDASGNNDKVYIDDVVISACSNSAKGSTEYQTISSTKGDNVIDLTLRPNPSSNEVNLVFNVTEKSSSKMLIMDFTGKVVLSKIFANEVGLQKRNVDLSVLNNGIYYVTLLTNKERITKRLVVVK